MNVGEAALGAVVVETEPLVVEAELVQERNLQVMRRCAERTLFSQDDREPRQTSELEDALRSDERLGNNREECLAP